MVRQCGVDPLPNEGPRFTISLREPLALPTHENFSVDIVWLSVERLGERPQRAGVFDLNLH
jgi:hypothetical protein